MRSSQSWDIYDILSSVIINWPFVDFVYDIVRSITSFLVSSVTLSCLHQAYRAAKLAMDFRVDATAGQHRVIINECFRSSQIIGLHSPVGKAAEREAGERTNLPNWFNLCEMQVSLVCFTQFCSDYNLTSEIHQSLCEWIWKNISIRKYHTGFSKPEMRPAPTCLKVI